MDRKEASSPRKPAAGRGRRLLLLCLAALLPLLAASACAAVDDSQLPVVEEYEGLKMHADRMEERTVVVVIDEAEHLLNASISYASQPGRAYSWIFSDYPGALTYDAAFTKEIVRFCEDRMDAAWVDDVMWTSSRVEGWFSAAAAAGRLYGAFCVLRCLWRTMPGKGNRKKRTMIFHRDKLARNLSLAAAVWFLLAALNACRPPCYPPVRIALLFGGFALTAAFGVYSAYWYRKNREWGSPRQRSAMEIPWDRDWFLLARGLAIAVLLELAALAYRTGRLTYACRQAAGGVLLAALTAAGIYLTLRCRSIRRKGEERNPSQ